MDSFGVVGLNWRQGGPHALSRFTLPTEDREEHVAALARRVGLEELVYLATCNRVEMAFVAAQGVPVSEYRRRLHTALGGEPEQAERELRAWQGEGAAEHLFLVACGLDSARLGETEILGQVRSALQVSQSIDLVGERLSVLFVEALKLAKKTRLETALGSGRTSLAEIGLDRLREHLGESSGTIALVGVSAMTERCAFSLVGEGRDLLIVNRTMDRAEALAAKLAPRASALPLEEFLRSPPQVDALISATSAPGPLFGASELARLNSRRDSQQALLCVDFAIEADVDPEAANAAGCQRLGMEEVIAIAEGNREAQLRESGEARALVDRALTTLSGRLARLRADQAIGALHDNYAAIATTQINKLLEIRLQDLDEERSQLLRQFAQRLARHYAHLPASGLRELAASHGPGIVHEFFSHAAEDLAKGLNEALDEKTVYAKWTPGSEPAPPGPATSVDPEEGDRR
jgi:glutamyl-tRNA reductase